MKLGGMDLPPFDRARACAKCGSIGARVEYRGPMSATTNPDRAGNVTTAWPERLHRTCGECGYSWDEATIDALEEKPEDPDRLHRPVDVRRD